MKKPVLICCGLATALLVPATNAQAQNSPMRPPGSNAQRGRRTPAPDAMQNGPMNRPAPGMRDDRNDDMQPGGPDDMEDDRLPNGPGANGTRSGGANGNGRGGNRPGMNPPASSVAMTVDGNFLYILRGEMLVKLDKNTLKLLASTMLPRLMPDNEQGGMNSGVGQPGRASDARPMPAPMR